MKNPTPSVLIVDDNSLFIERMAALLKEVSIRSIEIANNYNEALLKLESCMPDIVLLDINLPGKNGVELLKKIKLSEYSCRVIMLSNHANEYYRRICIGLGVTHFLDKSNDFSLVSGIIKNMNFTDCISSK
ncbi:MAG: response regulator transcription factor [Chitinophagaceae bacterium]|nr:response regulator transcription factor [Chitinophagaceae bacterium]